MSSDGTQVAGGQDKSLYVWALESEFPTDPLPGIVGLLDCLCFSLDGELLAAAGGTQGITIWSTKQRAIIQHYEAHDGEVCSLQFFSSGDLLLSSGLMER